MSMVSTLVNMHNQKYIYVYIFIDLKEEGTGASWVSPTFLE